MICFIVLFVSCGKNHSPVITSFKMNPITGSAGTVFLFEADASDEDGDTLSFQWTSNGGEFLSAIDTTFIKWKSPIDGSGNTFTIKVLVSDGEFEVTQEESIALTDPLFGGVSGYVYFSGCLVPVDGAKVSISGMETITDELGHYFLSGLLSGADSIKVSKAEFGPIRLAITIPSYDVLDINIEMTSVNHTTKAFGKIVDQDGKILKNISVIMLNPDGTDSNIKDVSDEEGVYRIGYVPHGRRTLVVRRSSTSEFRFVEISKSIEFAELEERHDFVMEKIPLTGQFTDPRDNSQYPFKTVGTQTWMTTNLHYLPDVSPANTQTITAPCYYVYGYNGIDTAQAKRSDNYKNYGVLYNWKAAMIACPPGWHLPDNDEFDTLINELSPNSGEKMKTTTGWLLDGNGNNLSGLYVLPSGWLDTDGVFKEIGLTATFLSSNGLSASDFTVMMLSSGSDDAWLFGTAKKAGHAIRCIRN